MSDFKSLEDTRQVAIETAHRAIVELASKAPFDASDAQQLKTLTGLINDVEELEIKRWMAKAKSRPGVPDPERARRIAAGEEDK